MKKRQDGASASSTTKPKRNVVVMVLGDIGRSPRMQYHALSLANVEEAEVHVDFIGFKGFNCFYAPQKTLK